MKKQSFDTEIRSVAAKCALARDLIAQGEAPEEALKRFGLTALEYAVATAKHDSRAFEFGNSAKYSDPEKLRGRLASDLAPGAPPSPADPGKRKLK